MAKRVKPLVCAPALNSLEEADATLAAIAGRKRHLDLLKLSAAEEIEGIKLRLASEAEPVKDEIDQLEKALGRFVDANQTVLFNPRKKSIALSFGTIGFRLSTSVKTLSKWTWERVLCALQSAELRECIRVKEEVDKEALRGLAPDQLTKVGVRLVSEDAFFYELREDLPSNEVA